MKFTYIYRRMAVPANIAKIISELNRTKSEKEIAKMVYDQLTKDFNTAGLSVQFPSDSDYRNWSAELTKTLRESSGQQLAALLYSVDISEKMSAAITGTEAFAELILYREFVKIYYRLYYNR